MGDYTPTDEEVRLDYVVAYTNAESSQILAGLAFDRWLAAHDATVRADHEKAVRERIAQDITRELGRRASGRHREEGRMSTREQARAEDEKRVRDYLDELDRIAAKRGHDYMADEVHSFNDRPLRRSDLRTILAGHEAATRTRVVTTVTELDALPVGSVVLSEYEAVWERESDLCWIETGNTWRVQSTDIALPARVLYNPEEDS